MTSHPIWCDQGKDDQGWRQGAVSSWIKKSVTEKLWDMNDGHCLSGEYGWHSCFWPLVTLVPGSSNDIANCSSEKPWSWQQEQDEVQLSEARTAQTNGNSRSYHVVEPGVEKEVRKKTSDEQIKSGEPGGWSSEALQMVHWCWASESPERWWSTSGRSHITI